MEHIPKDQLNHFISELMRVASKGYIEVPLYSYEVFTNIEHHLSFLNVDEKNKLYFLEKDITVYDNVMDILEKSSLKKKIINYNLDSGFEWNDKIEFEIVNDMQTLISKNRKYEFW